MYEVDANPVGQFRSKLERDFAVHLTYQGLPWKYEPQKYQIDSFRHYTPDFAVQVENEMCLVEVKPTFEMALADRRMWKLAHIVQSICLVAFKLPDDTWCALARDVDFDMWVQLETESFVTYVANLRIAWNDGLEPSSRWV